MPIPNTTCDYFEAGKEVGIDEPNISGLFITLDGDFKEGNSGTENLRWTHRMLIDPNVVVIYTELDGSHSRVYVPNELGTEFEVVFVEEINRSRANAYKRVYLERKTVPWPTQEL